MILRRLPDSRFSEIVPAWVGAVVAILGGGPSLTVEQVERVRIGRVRCIAINNSFMLAPWADMLYGADASWHAAHQESANFSGLRCGIENRYDRFTDDRIHVVSRADLPIATTTCLPAAGDTTLIAGRNSLHQAMNLAILAGATTVLLLGCDGRRVDGRTHWHGGHQGRTLADDFFDDMRRAFSAQENALMRRGIRVVNCSPGSAIDSFPKIALEDALKETLTVV